MKKHIRKTKTKTKQNKTKKKKKTEKKKKRKDRIPLICCRNNMKPMKLWQRYLRESLPLTVSLSHINSTK
jgi:hypothetical protein